MNREILFKAKRKDWRDLPKEQWWIEGLPTRMWRELYIQDSEDENTAYKIAPDTLCQYTGLTDKNGKKIWENDICDRKEKYPEIVAYNKGDWQLDYSYAFGKEMHSNACNLGFYAYERNCVEVIGNIFDNADLLEV